jgi:hypothetical protein
VSVTVRAEIRATADYEINEAEYLDWLGGRVDDAEAIRDFIDCDPDSVEIFEDVYELAKDREFVWADIVQVVASE